MNHHLSPVLYSKLCGHWLFQKLCIDGRSNRPSTWVPLLWMISSYNSLDICIKQQIDPKKIMLPNGCNGPNAHANNHQYHCSKSCLRPDFGRRFLPHSRVQCNSIFIRHLGFGWIPVGGLVMAGHWASHEARPRRI